jgi:phenylalanyl-tRNA synthetase alpha chain
MVDIKLNQEDLLDLIKARTLAHMDQNGGVLEDSNSLVAQGFDAKVVYGALNSLVAENYVKLSNIEVKTIGLTAEGADCAENGTAERRYVEALVLGEETAKTDVEKIVGAQVAKIGFGKAMKNKWLKVGGAKKELVTRTVTDIVDAD